jgi:hypothetical protein
VNMVRTDTKRVRLATEALDPELRRAAWPLGMPEPVLRQFERRAGILPPRIRITTKTASERIEA